MVWHPRNCPSKTTMLGCRGCCWKHKAKYELGPWTLVEKLKFKADLVWLSSSAFAHSPLSSAGNWPFSFHYEKHYEIEQHYVILGYFIFRRNNKSADLLIIKWKQLWRPRKNKILVLSDCKCKLTFSHFPVFHHCSLKHQSKTKKVFQAITLTIQSKGHCWTIIVRRSHLHDRFRDRTLAIINMKG